MPYVAIGCSHMQPYDYLLPFTVRLWKERIGMDVILLLSGDPQEWLRRPVFNELDEDECYFVGEIEGFDAGTVAQSARQHVAAMEWLKEDDYIISSDSDLWPIKKDFYWGFDESPMTFWYANAYLYENHCTCHMGATVKTWRDVMGLKAGSLSAQLKDTFARKLAPKQEGLNPGDAGWQAWNFDEWNTSEVLRQQEWYPDQCKMIERVGQPPNDRIDRSNWRDLKPDDVDAHLLRPSHDDENWPLVRKLWAELMPDHVEWADAYRERYKG